MKSKFKKIQKKALLLLVFILSIYFFTFILINFLPENIIGLEFKSKWAFHVRQVPIYFRINPRLELGINLFGHAVKEIDGKGKYIYIQQDSRDSSKYSLRGAVYVTKNDITNDYAIDDSYIWIKNVYHVWKGTFFINTMSNMGVINRDESEKLYCFLQITSLDDDSNIGGPSLLLKSEPNDSLVFYLDKKGDYIFIKGKGTCEYSSNASILHMKSNNETPYKFNLPMPYFSYWNHGKNIPFYSWVSNYR
jgi:hypothetical protein